MSESAYLRPLQVCGSSHVPTRKAADLGKHEVCAPTTVSVSGSNLPAEPVISGGGSLRTVRRARRSPRPPQGCSAGKLSWP
jgi:hypothetical protein